jgi:hypothetical protein
MDLLNRSTYPLIAKKKEEDSKGESSLLSE